MNLIRFSVWLAVVSMLVLFGTGCGGFSTSQSISPASFFMPGLLQNDPQIEKVEPVASNPSGETAEKLAKSL